MRYELDANGYILAVYFGCYSGTGKCIEYTGTVPTGYTDLNDWSDKAIINAYYINEAGNLALDRDRLAEIEAQVEQETIDNEAILRKDLYGTTNVLETQYKSETATGQVIAIDNVKKINPKVKITSGGYANDYCEWDGDTTGREFEDFGDACYYKVSDRILTPEELVGKKITITDATGTQLEEYVITPNDIVPTGEGYTLVLFNGELLVMMVVTAYEDANRNGIYFIKMEVGSNIVYASSLSLGEKKIELPKIVDLIVSGKNMLPNNATMQKISDVTFIRNSDGSIYINGTATENIEYNLAGSGTNTTSIFVLKKGLDYYLNLGGLECIMNFYDGSTSQVYDGADGLINLSESKEVTQVLIKIPTGTTIDKTIYPMLEYGSTASEYEENGWMNLKLDISGYENVDYISIEDGLIHASSNDELNYVGKGSVNLFDGYNTVYTLQDTNIEMTYFINDMRLEGTTTANNTFRIDEEGNITATGGTVGGFTLTKNRFSSKLTPPEIIPNYDYDYTEQDVTNIQNYLIGKGTLTEEQMILYDLNQDGEVNTLDLGRVWKLVLTGVSHAHPGRFEINTDSPFNTILLKDKDGKEKINISLNGIQMDGRHLYEQTVLWEGCYYMTENHIIDLTETPISSQHNGIVLVFSAYSDSTAHDYNFCTFFLPKEFANSYPGCGVTIPLQTANYSYIGTKYLYFSDKKITGNANNDATGTGNSGIKYTNNYWVLRKIIGV